MQNSGLSALLFGFEWGTIAWQGWVTCALWARQLANDFQL